MHWLTTEYLLKLSTWEQTAFFYLQIKYLKVWVCTLNKYFPLRDFYFFIHKDCSVCLWSQISKNWLSKTIHLSRIYDNIYLFCFSNSVNKKCISYFCYQKYIYFFNLVNFSKFLRFFFSIRLMMNYIELEFHLYSFFLILLALSGDLFTHVFIFK